MNNFTLMLDCNPAREVSKYELKERIYIGVLGFLGASQLVTFPHRTNVTVRDRTVDCDAIAVLAHDFKAALVEVNQSPVPYLGIDHCIRHQLLSWVSIHPGLA